MKPKIGELVEKYVALEKEILEEVSKLPNAEGECNCPYDEVVSFSYIHFGNMFNEVMTVCLNCGGIVETLEG